MEMLTYEQLEKLNTKRLISLLKVVRIRQRQASKSMACECCGEWLGTDEAYEKEYTECVKPFEDYADKIKNILGSREHVEKAV